ncbi:hypothetical protein AGMMS49940_09180 [Spirochaetia bacterium]|nr:hypothetical protein AGMMS49940_09180 [Spirochaetia bacterium]
MAIFMAIGIVADTVTLQLLLTNPENGHIEFNEAGPDFTAEIYPKAALSISLKNPFLHLQKALQICIGNFEIITNIRNPRRMGF